MPSLIRSKFYEERAMIIKYYSDDIEEKRKRLMAGFRKEFG